jgi:hypothetical protein
MLALSEDAEERAPAAAAQPPDHVAEFQPAPEKPTATPSIEVTPAEPPTIDLVRPEELDVEAQPQPGAPVPRRPAVPQRPAPKPSFRSSKPDYGI